jgi:hypothetical protein
VATDKFITEVSETLQADINSVRNLATNQMKAQEKELVDTFSKQFDDVQTYMNQNVKKI